MTSIFRFLVLGVLTMTLLFCGNSARGQSDERIWVENIVINGKPVRFIIDTGASHIMIFKHAAKRLGLSFDDTEQKAIAPDEVQIPDEVQMVMCESCDFQIGDKHLRNQLFVVPSPSNFMKEDGVVGWGPIRNNSIFFEGERGGMSILTNIPERVSSWARLKLQTNTLTIGVGSIEWDEIQPGHRLRFIHRRKAQSGTVEGMDGDAFPPAANYGRLSQDWR
jgi:hypothetical protein